MGGRKQNNADIMKNNSQGNKRERKEKGKKRGRKGRRNEKLSKTFDFRPCKSKRSRSIGSDVKKECHVGAKASCPASSPFFDLKIKMRNGSEETNIVSTEAIYFPTETNIGNPEFLSFIFLYQRKKKIRICAYFIECSPSDSFTIIYWHSRQNCPLSRSFYYYFNLLLLPFRLSHAIINKAIFSTVRPFDHIHRSAINEAGKYRLSHRTAVRERFPNIFSFTEKYIFSWRKRHDVRGKER